jgi:hypothetical protein
VGIFLGGWTRVCSGTQINSQWIVTSSSCVPADQENDLAVAFGDGSSQTPNRIVVNPTDNVALIQVPQPAPMTPAVRPLYNGTLSALAGKTVTAYGAGNGSTTDAAPDPNDIGLRLGTFTIGSPTVDTFTLQPVGNVALVAGDEGGGTIYADASGMQYLVGVHVLDGSGNFHDVSSVRFHDWVMEQIYGVNSYVDTFGRDPGSGLLNTGYTGTDTWTPCGGGGFSWSASYDFGTDANGSIAVNGTTMSLKGQSTSSGHGSGAMTIGVTTTNTQVWGLLSLIADCDAPAVACPAGATECVTNAVTVSNTSVSGTWQPCGPTGCFAWGATLTGAQSGDSIVVNGTSATTSSSPGSAMAGDTCGSVPVQVNYGSGTGTRSEMDVWAVCGCDDAPHTCATAPDGNQRCGSHSNQCGLSFNCGSCAGGYTCSSAGECTCPGTVCSGACVDTNTDVNNCGGCGNQCVLVEGTPSCTSGCCSPLSRCGSSCVNLVEDPNNCGACGNVCTHGICNGGTCLCEPSTCGSVTCGTISDGCGHTLNCGTCGSGEVCRGGSCQTCVPSCAGKRCGASNGCGGTCFGSCSGTFACCDLGEGNACRPAKVCSSQ